MKLCCCSYLVNHHRHHSNKLWTELAEVVEAAEVVLAAHPDEMAYPAVDGVAENWNVSVIEIVTSAAGDRAALVGT